MGPATFGQSMVADLGLPAPVAIGWAVTLIELVGAMLPGAELDLALIAGALGVIVLGPGRPSLDHGIGIEREVPVLAPADEGTAAPTG